MPNDRSVNSVIKKIFRSLFNRITIKFDTNYRDGLRLVAKSSVRYRWIIVGIFFCNLFAAVFEGGTMGVLVLAVSVLVEGNNVQQLAQEFGAFGRLIGDLLPPFESGMIFVMLVSVAVTAQILKSLLAYLGNWCSIHLQSRVTRELQERSTNQVMDYSYAEVTREAAGQINGKIGLTASLANVISTMARGLYALSLLTTYLLIMLVLSVPLALTALLIVSFMSLGLIRLVTKIRDLGKQALEAGLDTGRLAVEFLHAHRLLRVFNATRFAKERINSARAISIRASERSSKIKAAVDPVIDSLTMVTAGGFLMIGYLSSTGSALEVVPKLLLFLLMLNRMMPQAKALNEVRLSLATSRHSISVSGEFLRVHDKEFTRQGGVKISVFDETISFNDIGFSYPGTDINILHDLSFDIRRGETVALVGSSGAGKSTVLNLLLALYQPTQGIITVDGTDLNEIDIEAWRSKIGTVDQDTFLFNTTIRENIAFSGHNTDEEVVTAARQAYADEFIRALPEGYQTAVGDRGLRLSGGQQQRLALARALLRDPYILVLDEATSALDSESEKLIQRTLDELNKDMTMIIIAHRLSTIKSANKILVMEGGRLVESGTFDDLVEAGQRFAKLWQMQAAGNT